MDRRRFIHASALAGLSASLPGALRAAPAAFEAFGSVATA